MTKLQKKKYEAIKAYLRTDIAQGSITIVDTSVTFFYSISAIRQVFATFCITGYNICLGKTTKEYIQADEITGLYRAMLKGDEDFKSFITGG